jgi:hypothetical protein
VAVYTLFSQAATGSSLVADGSSYTMGVQFTVSVSGATATAVWFYSAAGAPDLPVTIALYLASPAGTGTLITSDTATWTPNTPGGGWVRAPFSSPPILTSGAAYKACVLHTAFSNWYSQTAAYWTGSNPQITNGPLSAPNNANGDGGQDTFNTNATLSYPATSFNSSNYWVDVEVTTGAAPPPNVVQTLTPESGGISGWVMLPPRGRAGAAL